MNSLFSGWETSIMRSCNPPISKWDVSEVKDFSGMFYMAASAFNQDLSKWNVGNGLCFRYMFLYTAAFNQDISGWNVANGSDFEGMFAEAVEFNQDLSE